MKTIVYQYCFWIPNLTKIDFNLLISYSSAQSALIHNINLSPPKHQLNQKPGIDYQPWILEVPSDENQRRENLG